MSKERKVDFTFVPDEVDRIAYEYDTEIDRILEEEDRVVDELNDILEQRAEKYGDFNELADIDMALKEVIFNNKNVEDLPNYMKVALIMITHKVARIVNGNSFHKDHWNDIAGYAMLVARNLD